MSFAKSFVLFLAAVASVDALATVHVARHNLHHRSIAARVAEPQPNNVALAARGPETKARKRCKPRLSFISAAPSSTAAVPSAPINAAPIPSSSSAPVQQKPSPSPAPAPAPSPPPKAVTTFAPAPSPSQPSSGNSGNNNNGGNNSNLPSFMRGTQTGQGTFYDTGLGACGITNNDNQYIAAVSHLLFDNYPGYARVNPNKNPMCGRTVTVHYKGKSVKVALTDRCAACAVTDLDFSPAAFAQLASFDEGRINGITWTWD